MMGKGFEEIGPEQYYTRYERSPVEAYSRDHWRPILVTAIAKYCKHKIVLDLGCGGSAYTDVIASYTDNALGLDVSELMLDYTKNKHLNLSLVRADARLVPLKTKSIDTVVSIGLLEYLEYMDQVTVLGEINRVLRPDGTGIIVCPNKYSAARMAAKLICKILGKKYPHNEPSRREMLRLFKCNILTVIESRMDDGLIFLPTFLDRLMGKRVYFFIEQLSKNFGRNPFSNVMMFVVRKGMVNR